MKNTFGILLAFLFAVPAWGAPSLIGVTNTRTGVTLLNSSNAPVPRLKDLDANQFGSNATKLMIMENARLTNPVISGTFQMLSLATNMLLATDANGFVVPTTTPAGSGTLTGVTNIGGGVRTINDSNAPVPIFKTVTNTDGTVTITDQITNIDFKVSTAFATSKLDNAWLTWSNGAPEGQQIRPVGWRYVDTNSADTNTLVYWKLTGSGSTGWFAIAPGVTSMSAFLSTNVNADQFTLTGAATNDLNIKDGPLITNLNAKGDSIFVGESSSTTVTLRGGLVIGNSGGAFVSMIGPWLMTGAYIVTAASGTYPITDDRVAVFKDWGDGSSHLTNGAASVAEVNRLVGVTGGIQTNIDNRMVQLGNADANFFYAGPSNGAPAAAVFRPIRPNDLTLAGVVFSANGAGTNNVLVDLTLNGNALLPTAATLTFDDQTIIHSDGTASGRIAIYAPGTVGLSYSAVGEDTLITFQTNIDNRLPISQFTSYTNLAVIKVGGTPLAYPVNFLGFSTNAGGDVLAPTGGTAGTLINSNLVATTANQLVRFLGTDKTNTGPVTVGPGLALVGDTLSVTNSTNNVLVNSGALVLNTVYTNGTNVLLVSGAGILSSTALAAAQVRFVVESPAGTWNPFPEAKIGLGAVVTHAIPFSAVVPPNMRYYPTNESEAGATATLATSFTNALTGGLAGGGGSGGGSAPVGTMVNVGPVASTVGQLVAALDTSGTNFIPVSGTTNLTLQTPNILETIVGQVAAYTITTNDSVILADATAVSNLVLTLPNATLVKGWSVTVKKVDTTTNNIVTITNTASQTIDGLLMWQLKQRGRSVGLRSDGTNWSTFGTTIPSITEIIGKGTSAGRWWDGSIVANNLGTGAFAASTMKAFPFLLSRVTSIDQLALNVTAGAAGTARVGLYEDNGNGYPSRLLVDAGTSSVSGTGVLTYTTGLPISLQPGLYWRVSVSDVTATCRGASVATAFYNLGLDATLPTSTRVGWSASFAITNLPAFFPTGAAELTTISTWGPSVFLRMSQ